MIVSARKICGQTACNKCYDINDQMRALLESYPVNHRTHGAIVVLLFISTSIRAKFSLIASVGSTVSISVPMVEFSGILPTVLNEETEAVTEVTAIKSATG